MKIARFEKVSLNQFINDYKALINSESNDDYIKTLYDQIILPKRATISSAGYDFSSPISFILKPNEIIKVPTGIRCYMEKDYVLELYPRSSLGFKYQMTLLNTVGIIDADYYHAQNEGHIIIAICNHSNKDMEIKANDRFVQGVFLAYYLAEETEVSDIRTGGFGSSNK